MKNENLSNLKIHVLSKSQYDQVVENDKIDSTALYLTPEDPLPEGSTTTKGIVQLSSSTSSDSTTLAATASAVKAAYDMANHDHPYLSNTTNYAVGNGLNGSARSADKVNSRLVITINGGTNETEDQITFDGSSAKGLDITLAKLGAAASSHTHSDLYIIAGQEPDTELGYAATAEGGRTTASGNYSHAEGWFTKALDESAHAEGGDTIAEGYCSHAEGAGSHSLGLGAHAEGDSYAYGQVSHAEGQCTNAFGEAAHAEGSGTWVTQIDPWLNLSLDNLLTLYRTSKCSAAIGAASHVEGNNCIAYDENAHAEGNGTIAYGKNTHTEGKNTLAIAENSHAEGYNSIVYGPSGHAEGYYSVSETTGAHAEGYYTTSSGTASHAEGRSSKWASDAVSHDSPNVGDIVTFWNDSAFTLAYGVASHAEGINGLATGAASHVEGSNCLAVGDYAHAEGLKTKAYGNQHAQGHYNKTYEASNSGTEGVAFIVGNGSSTDSSNAFRVTYAGEVYANAAYNASGADYAEFFEWLDKNPGNEDRRGYFVTLDGEKLKIAGPDDYILGIISGQPAIIGNGDEDWQGRYIKDEFGAFITEEFEYEEEELIDHKTSETKTTTKIGTRYKQNPNYDSTVQYIQRADRPEWAAVGMLGVLSVRDDGTCQVNGYCKVTEGGIATASETGYRVIKRVNDHVVKVIFR